ncbi:MAG: hypothetical protein AAGA99_21370 [Actinomycetota bacterium]
MVADVMTTVRSLPRSTWLRAIGIAVVAYLVIGIPTDVVPNPIFGRSSIPVRWWDPVVLATTSLLTGLVLAIRPEDLSSTADRGTLAGGVGSLLAVGCPTCNHLVVAALGTSGALSFFQPIQPFLGVAAIGVLLWVLRRRITDLRDPSCRLA